MWVYFDGGFVSIVLKKGEALHQVRARKREDLQAFINRAQLEAPPSILQTDDADYRFRCFMNRKNVTRALARIVEELDYANFKDRVFHREGPERAHIYGEVWSASLAIEGCQDRDKSHSPPRKKARGRDKTLR